MIDDYRKRRLERSHTDSIDVGYDKAAEKPVRFDSPSHQLDSRERSRLIHRMLMRIPEDLRQSVVLRDLEEMTYEEIAELLQLPLGTVKSRINRGRA